MLGACFLYPTAEEGWTCDTDELCPMILDKDANGEDYYSGQFFCDQETNVCDNPNFYPAGVAKLGEACSSDATCVDELYCQPWQGAGVCTGYCLPADPQCPEDFDCEPFSPPYDNYGACLPSDGEIKQPGSDGCVSSVVCVDGQVCLPSPTDGEDKYCVTLCPVDEENACPEGHGCWSYGNPTGGCFPSDMFPGAPVDEEPEADAGSTEDAPSEDTSGLEDLVEPGPEIGAELDEETDPAGPAVVEEEPTPSSSPAADGCGGGPGSSGVLMVLMAAWMLSSRRLNPLRG